MAWERFKEGSSHLENFCKGKNLKDSATCRKSLRTPWVQYDLDHEDGLFAMLNA